MSLRWAMISTHDMQKSAMTLGYATARMQRAPDRDEWTIHVHAWDEVADCLQWL